MSNNNQTEQADEHVLFNYQDWMFHQIKLTSRAHKAVLVFTFLAA